MDLKSGHIRAQLNAVRNNDLSAVAELFEAMLGDSSGSVVIAAPDERPGYAARRVQDLIDDANLKHRRYGGRHPVTVLGANIEVSTSIKMKNGVALSTPDFARGGFKAAAGFTGNVIETEGYRDLAGSDSSAARDSAVSDFSIQNIRVDGNRALITADADEKIGNAFAIFGRHFLIEKCHALNVVGDGLVTDYVSGTYGVSPFDGRVDGFTCDVSGRRSYRNNVSDLHADNINSRSPSQLGDGLYAAIKLDRATHCGSRWNIWRGGQQTAKHSYGIHAGPNAGTSHFCAVIETASIANFFCEADMVEAAIRSYNCLGDAHAILAGAKNLLRLLIEQGGIGASLYGLRLGAVGAAARSNIVEIVGDGMAGGMVYFVNSGGGNIIRGRTYAAAGAIPYLGNAHATDDLDLLQDASLAADQYHIIKKPFRTTTLTAFGTNSTNATEVRAGYIKATPNDANAGLKLQNPSAAKWGGTLSTPYPGMFYDIHNVHASLGLNVYPHTDGSFHGLAANAAFVIPAGKRAIIINEGYGWSAVLTA